MATGEVGERRLVPPFLSWSRAASVTDNARGLRCGADAGEFAGLDCCGNLENVVLNAAGEWFLYLSSDIAYAPCFANSGGRPPAQAPRERRGSLFPVVRNVYKKESDHGDGSLRYEQ